VTALVLFDLDNTLVDREAAFRRWAVAFLRERQMPDVVDELEQVDRDGLAPRREVMQWLIARGHLADDADDLLAQYRETYPTYVTIPASTLTALALLRDDGWRLGIVTNGSPSQWRKIDVTGLRDVVDGICVSDDVGVAKPHEAIFIEAARRCGCALDGWMVGDSPAADIAGGVQCGLRTVWMHRGRAWSENAFAPTAHAATIPDAVAIIRAAS
jgi:HAD superfamily hydrolase (TIGR01549 family)